MVQQALQARAKRAWQAVIAGTSLRPRLLYILLILSAHNVDKFFSSDRSTYED
jgi:hypothetical protein